MTIEKFIKDYFVITEARYDRTYNMFVYFCKSNLRLDETVEKQTAQNEWVQTELRDNLITEIAFNEEYAIFKSSQFRWTFPMGKRGEFNSDTKELFLPFFDTGSTYTLTIP